MSAPVLERPAPSTASPASRTPPPQPREPSAGAVAAVAAVLLTASLSLGRVYVGFDFFWPVAGAVVAALAVGWAGRRLRLGPWTSLAVSALCWAWYVALAFLPTSLAAGVVPTPQTWSDGVALWARGWELVLLRPAPTFAEPGLLLLTVAGVWAVAYVVDTLVFLLRAPLAAIVMAIVLWVVPLTLSPGGDAHWIWFVPFLSALAALLLTAASSDVGRFGKIVAPPGGGIRARGGTPLAATLALGAIVLGSVAAERLPDLGDRPWLPLRGLGQTAVASNPIVGMRQRLVSQSTSTVFTVRTTRPVYLRTTALDVYGENEEWTNDGISAQPIGETVPSDVSIPHYQQVPVEIEVVNLPEAVLVPLPYQTAAVFGPVASSLQYDRSLSTFTLDAGLTLQPGDRYAAIADIPAPTPEQLDAAEVGGEDPRLTLLPDSVPPEVGQLAREIVDAAGATTRYRQALAIQDSLRTWTYSLNVPSGHSRSAMAAFLESRTGYCEQFAGTMAAMLRSLGIPARVAVGFTPGVPTERADSGVARYVVSQANAHAWVEVLFPEIGWLAFEPTPRSDGNVLVPSATNLAPELTARELAPLESLSPESSAVGLDEDPLEDGAVPPVQDAPATGPGSTSPALAARLPSPWMLAAIGGILVAGAMFGWGTRRRRAAVAARTPGERVLHASYRIRLLGTALGVPPAPSATDGEYLRRLVDGRAAGDGSAAASTLARCVERARWARDLPEDYAREAEVAGAELEGLLLQPLPNWRRRLVLLLRVLAPATARLRQVPERALTAARLRLAGLPRVRGGRAGSG